MEANKMDCDHHTKYKFGISYPGTIRGVGSPRDILAFFDALKLASSNPKVDYPWVWTLRKMPVFGEDMLPLFEEVQRIKSLFETIAINKKVLTELGLVNRATHLDTKAKHLAGLFEVMLEILGEQAPEFVKIAKDIPILKVFELGNIRIGPIEPLVASSRFGKLPAGEFDDANPPLWLRNEIFDDDFYTGKV